MLIFGIGRTYAQAASRRQGQPGLPFNPENPFDTPIPHPPVQVQRLYTSDDIEDPQLELLSDSETIIVDSSSQYTRSVFDDTMTVRSSSKYVDHMPGTPSAYVQNMPPPSNQIQGLQRRRRRTNTLDTSQALEATNQRVIELRARVQIAQEQRARVLYDEEAQLRQMLLELDG